MNDVPSSQEELNKRFVETASQMLRSVEKMRASLNTHTRQIHSVTDQLDEIAKLPAEERDKFKDYIDDTKVWLEGRGLAISQSRCAVQAIRQQIADLTVDIQVSQKAVAAGKDGPPLMGEFLICLFVRPDRQDERLADFQECYHKRWLSRFPRPIANVIYVAHLVWAAVDVARVTAWASAVDALWRLWDK